MPNIIPYRAIAGAASMPECRLSVPSCIYHRPLKVLVMPQSLVKDLSRFVPLCTDCSEISHHNLWIMMRFHKYRAYGNPSTSVIIPKLRHCAKSTDYSFLFIIMAVFHRDVVRNAFILSYQTLRHYQVFYTVPSPFCPHPFTNNA